MPSVGEIDIMENIQGMNTNGPTSTVVRTRAGLHEKLGIGTSRPCAASTCQGAMHTYTMEWTAASASTTDAVVPRGVQFHSVSANQVDAATWAAATSHGFFLVLNVSMGADFPGAFGGGTNDATRFGRPLRRGLRGGLDLGAVDLRPGPGGCDGSDVDLRPRMADSEHSR